MSEKDKAKSVAAWEAFAERCKAAGMPRPDEVTIDKPCEARSWNGKKWVLSPIQPKFKKKGKK